MATIAINASNTTRKNTNINIFARNLTRIAQNHRYLKPHVYRKSFNDTTLMATIIISGSNRTRTNNNINTKNLNEIYYELH